MAAPAFNNAVSIKFSNDTSQAYNAGTGTGRILVVGVAVDDDTDNITGITYNGVALTNVNKVVSDGLSASVELWYLIDPASGSNTLAINASASDTYVAIVSYVSGAKLINPIGKTASVIGDSTTATVSFTPTMADSLIFGMVANDATDTMAGNNSCTELLEDVNGLRGGIYYKTSASTASHTVGATGGDDDWAIIGLEIKPQTYVILNQAVTTLTPSDGTLKGNASWVNGGAGASYIQLTAASATQTGQYELNETLTDYFSAEFDIYAGGGTGADGTWFYWGDSSTPSTEDSANSGYHVAFDEYEDKVFLSFNGSELASYSISTLDNSTWRSVRIIKNVNNILVYLGGTLVIAYTDTTRTLGSNLYGWGARTGGSTNSHRIRNLLVTTGANTIEQEGFRFRNDDGSETTATWAANQDTDVDLEADAAFRLRLLLNTTGDVEPQTYKLQYKLNAGSYRDVLAAETISSTNLATGGTASASHENLPSEGIGKLFDGNTSSKWLAFNTTPWVQYQFASSATHLVVKYALTSANDDDTRDPKDWTLQGSNDGSNWTTVDTVSGETFASRALRKEYTCDTPGTTAYEYYRLNVVANNGSGSITQLAELQFYENTPEYVLLKASTNITASGEATTAQLTAPSGKTTSDFDAGRIQDDENPTDSITVSVDDYTEVEWSLVLKNAVTDDTIDFRVLSGTLVLDTYTQTPTITIVEAGSTLLVVGGDTLTTTFDSPTLIQKHTLAVAGDTLTLGSDNVALGVKLVVAGDLLSLSNDSVSIIQKYILTIDDNLLTLSNDSLNLNQKHLLNIAGDSLTTSSDNVALDSRLSVSDNLLNLSSDSPTLVQKHLLVIANSLLTLSNDSLNLTQKHLLNIAGDNLTTTSDEVTIIAPFYAVGDDSSLGLMSDNVLLTQKHLLVISGDTLSTNSDQVIIINTSWIDQSIPSSIWLDGSVNSSTWTDQTTPSSTWTNQSTTSSTWTNSTTPSTEWAVVG